jgi:hypothetical protein
MFILYANVSLNKFFYINNKRKKSKIQAKEKCNTIKFHDYVMYHVQTIRYSIDTNINKKK